MNSAPSQLRWGFSCCIFAVGYLLASPGLGQQDVAGIPSQDLRASGNPRMRYFLIGAEKGTKAPTKGFRLLIVLPGGDGGAEFHPFVKRIYKHALSKRYLIAQPVAVKWTPDQKIVWPTRKTPVPKQKFTTEEFVRAVANDVKGRHKIDDRYVFTLSWSSGGPAAYAISLEKNPCVTGSFIAMSVFKPKFLPPLPAAKGRAYFLYHSPDDRVCPFRMARAATTALRKNGAEVSLATYQGGHGWRGGVYPPIRRGIRWLETNRALPATPEIATRPGPEPSAVDLTIRPGVGVGPVKFGMSAEEVVGLLGEPTKQGKQDGRLDLTYDKLGMTLIFVDGRLVRVTLQPLDTGG